MLVAYSSEEKITKSSKEEAKKEEEKEKILSKAGFELATPEKNLFGETGQNGDRGLIYLIPPPPPTTGTSLARTCHICSTHAPGLDISVYFLRIFVFDHMLVS